MQHLRAQDAVLTVLGLEVAIVSEAARLDPCGKRRAQLVAIAAEAGIENRDFDSLAAVAGMLPAIYSQKSQMAGLVSVDGGKRSRIGVERPAVNVSERRHQGQGQAQPEGHPRSAVHLHPLPQGAGHKMLLLVQGIVRARRKGRRWSTEFSGQD